MSKDPSCDSKEETASGTYTSDALTIQAQVPVSLPWRPAGPDSSGDHSLAEEGCVCVCVDEGVWGLLGDTRQMPWGDALQLTSWERLNCPSRAGFRP